MFIYVFAYLLIYATCFQETKLKVCNCFMHLATCFYMYPKYLFINLCISPGCLFSFRHFVLTILVHLFILLTCFHHFKNVLYVSHVPPRLSPPPPLCFSFNQSCACTSCDFVIWLLHGADDVVFAGQQKVIFYCLFSLRS